MNHMPIINNTSVKLGVVPTHLGFIDALVPDENGRLPRNASGELVVIVGVKDLLAQSPVSLDAIQISAFGSTQPEDTDELITLIRDLGLEPQLVMMVGEVDPMSADDEDATVAQLLVNLQAAIRNGVTQVNSTSVEAWMNEDQAKSQEEFNARVAQNIRVHARAYREAGLADSCIKHWDVEFLRPGEFANFTTLEKIRPVISGLNAEVGRSFFRTLVDAAHCGDSGMSVPENESLIAAIAAEGELGSFHCSAKTTRGCFSTDDGWIGSLLAAAARTEKLTHVFVELFRHDDPALQPLRDLDPGHGVDTSGGRDYAELVVDGLIDTVRRLNNFKMRGLL